MTVDIRLLGPLAVVAPGGTVTAADFRSLKARRVLEVLSLSGGQRPP